MVSGGIVSAEEVEVSSSAAAAAEAEPITSLLDKDSIIDALESAGLDIEDLDVSVTEGKVVVKPTKYLGDAWDWYNSTLRILGMTWVSAGKESHWKSG
ncbi:hypothetical protein ES708_19428 [subsurface metagenome]